MPKPEGKGIYIRQIPSNHGISNIHAKTAKLYKKGAAFKKPR